MARSAFTAAKGQSNRVSEYLPAGFLAFPTGHSDGTIKLEPKCHAKHSDMPREENDASDNG